MFVRTKIDTGDTAPLLKFVRFVKVKVKVKVKAKVKVKVKAKFKRTKQTKWNETNETKRNEQRVRTPTRGGGNPPLRAGSPARSFRFVSFVSFHFVSFCLFCSFEFRRRFGVIKGRFEFVGGERKKMLKYKTDKTLGAALYWGCCPSRGNLQNRSSLNTAIKKI